MTIRDMVSGALGYVPMRVLDVLRNHQRGGGLAGSISRVMIARLIRYMKVEAEEFVLLDEPRLRFANDGSVISRRLYWLGMHGYEYGEVKLWRYLCACEEIGGVLEMGANTGYFTVAGASVARGRYTAVEANPRTAEYLKTNVRLNGLKDVEVIVAAVVGEGSDEELELHIPVEEDAENAPTGAYLGGGENTPAQGKRSVKVRTIEAAKLVDGVDLMKLDIEGHEYIVLDSIFEEILEIRPVIWVEVRRRTVQLRGLLAALAAEHGYTIHAIGENALHAVSAQEIRDIVLQKVYQTRDVILVPKEKGAVVRGYRA